LGFGNHSIKSEYGVSFADSCPPPPNPEPDPELPPPLPIDSGIFIFIIVAVFLDFYFISKSYKQPSTS
jgi:hypothetical protein